MDIRQLEEAFAHQLVGKLEHYASKEARAALRRALASLPTEPIADAVTVLRDVEAAFVDHIAKLHNPNNNNFVSGELDALAASLRIVRHRLASLTTEPPTLHAPDGSLPRPERVFDGLGFEGGLPKATVTAAPTCATCQHFQHEGKTSGYCADRRRHPMQGKLCYLSWSCPMWEGKP